MVGFFAGDSDTAEITITKSYLYSLTTKMQAQWGNAGPGFIGTNTLKNPAPALTVTEIARTPTSKHAPKSINYGWQPFRDVLLIMLDTGMRPGEIFRMRWEHVKWDREVIFIPRSKSA